MLLIYTRLDAVFLLLVVKLLVTLTSSSQTVCLIRCHLVSSLICVIYDRVSLCMLIVQNV